MTDIQVTTTSKPKLNSKTEIKQVLQKYYVDRLVKPTIKECHEYLSNNFEYSHFGKCFIYRYIKDIEQKRIDRQKKIDEIRLKNEEERLKYQSNVENKGVELNITQCQQIISDLLKMVQKDIGILDGMGNYSMKKQYIDVSMTLMKPILDMEGGLRIVTSTGDLAPAYQEALKILAEIKQKATTCSDDKE